MIQRMSIPTSCINLDKFMIGYGLMAGTTTLPITAPVEFGLIMLVL